MSGRTVRVRIAVAVDSEGNWYSVGWKRKRMLEVNPKYLRHCERLATDRVGTIRNVYWLTADLPIPEPAEIEAQVEEQR